MMKTIIKKKIHQILLRFHYEIRKTNTSPNPDTAWQKSSICQIENKFLMLLPPLVLAQLQYQSLFVNLIKCMVLCRVVRD